MTPSPRWTPALHLSIEAAVKGPAPKHERSGLSNDDVRLLRERVHESCLRVAVIGEVHAAALEQVFRERFRRILWRPWLNRPQLKR